MTSLMRPNRALRTNSSAVIGLALDFAERLPGGEKVRDQIDPGIGRPGEVAGLLRHIEGAAQQDRQLARCCVQGATWSSEDL